MSIGIPQGCYIGKYIKGETIISNLFQSFSGVVQTPKKTSSFMDLIKEEAKPANVAYTSNGAKAYKTSGSALVDINFHATNLRNLNESKVIEQFLEAFYEDEIIAWKWLFYLRDIRGGLGERKSFRTILKYLANIRPEQTKLVIPYVAEYGRFDDLWCLLETPLKETVLALIKEQLSADIKSYQENTSLSLLAKWLPSVSSKNANNKKYVKEIISYLEINEEIYRKTLSKLRKKLNIVEVAMAAKNWTIIDYSKVPARANLKYNGAFLRNDEKRRREFLNALSKGDKSVKINAGTLFPHDIVYKYRYAPIDVTLEELWRALPNTLEGIDKNIMVVADGSGSMKTSISTDSKVTCLDVANALAIYFSEHNKGVYKDKYITFSSNPKYVDFSKAATLNEKIKIALKHCEMANTNIHAVFKLILSTAKKNKLSQEEIPSTILIISDGGYDIMTNGNSDYLFEKIRKEYSVNGYELPQLVFWNVSRWATPVPMTQNKNGVILMSGYSVNACKQVLSNKLDPLEALMELLNDKRYEIIGELVNVR